MELVVKENVANKPMHNPPYLVGVIPVPDSHYKPELYSHYQATIDYNKLNQDIFEQTGKHKPADRKKTPKAVWCAISAATIFILYKLIRRR